VLFDEIEKAAPEVFNILLQVLDDGRLTDGQGRTVDFKNTVLIMTSNVGVLWLPELEKLDEDEVQRMVRQRLRGEGFRPEFINRIDEIIVFRPIAREQMRDIVNIQLERLRQRLSERHITLQLTSTARDRLAEMGYDEEFGARPLKRVIQREIENRIARELLDGTVRDGDTVVIDVKDGKFTLEAVRVEVPEEVHARR
jgi:ATP-dependent Clp protease ATP-binding subunit ClpB